MDQKEESRRQLKMFVDSLLTDLNSIRCTKRDKYTSQSSLISPTKSNLYPRKGFPVNILNVTKLGSRSLYIRWDIIDGKKITGYEIYLDNYLANRYHSAQHEAAVIYDIDVKKPHKITLAALSEGGDANADLVCKYMQRPMLCCCKPTCNCCADKENDATDPWIPSVYIYQPNSNEGNHKASIERH